MWARELPTGACRGIRHASEANVQPPMNAAGVAPDIRGHTRIDEYQDTSPCSVRSIQLRMSTHAQPDGTSTAIPLAPIRRLRHRRPQTAASTPTFRQSAPIRGTVPRRVICPVIYPVSGRIAAYPARNQTYREASPKCHNTVETIEVSGNRRKPRGWNPRGTADEARFELAEGFALTRFRGVLLRPLGHSSKSHPLRIA